MDTKQFLDELKAILPLDLIIEDSLKSKSYTCDWRGRISGEALCVVFPKHQDQIIKIVKLCSQYKIGIVPQGGNTSLCGAAVPDGSNKIPPIILNLSKLNKIIHLDSQSNTITVESGVTLAAVQEYAKTHNLYFPLSIAAQGSCQIGGNIATNCGGVHVLKYGMMRDLVLGMDAVLPNGELVEQNKNLYKNNTNFDLKQLFIGSEGTLGIITQATLKLFPRVQNYATILAGLSTISQALNLLNQLRPGFEVCAFEIINQTTQTIYNQHFPENKFTLESPWLVLFEIELKSEFNYEQFIQICNQVSLDIDQIILAQNEEERKKLWQMREHIPLAEKQHGIAVKHDISLPQSVIEQFIQENQATIKAHYPDTQSIIFGHLGDGNLHYNILSNDILEKAAFAEFEEKINQLVYEDVIKFKGSFSAEHGIGVLKKDWYKKYTDPMSYQLALKIKNLIDPENILNPKKIF